MTVLRLKHCCCTDDPLQGWYECVPKFCTEHVWRGFGDLASPKLRYAARVTPQTLELLTSLGIEIEGYRWLMGGMVWEFNGEFLGDGAYQTLGLVLPDWARVPLETELADNLPTFPACQTDLVDQRITGANPEIQPTPTFSLVLQSSGFLNQTHASHLVAQAAGGFGLQRNNVLGDQGYSASNLIAKKIEIDYVPVFPFVHVNVKESLLGPIVAEYQQSVSDVAFTIEYEHIPGSEFYAPLNSPPQFQLPPPFFNNGNAQDYWQLRYMGSAGGLVSPAILFGLRSETVPLCNNPPEPDDSFCWGLEFFTGSGGLDILQPNTGDLPFLISPVPIKKGIFPPQGSGTPENLFSTILNCAPKNIRTIE